MSTHTPEPWRVFRDGSYIEIDNGLPPEAPGYRHITNKLPVYDGGPKDIDGADGISLTCLADAHLMAASPKLLAACRAVVERWQSGDLAEAARMCDTAIAEATEFPTAATEDER